MDLGTYHPDKPDRTDTWTGAPPVKAKSGRKPEAKQAEDADEAVTASALRDVSQYTRETATEPFMDIPMTSKRMFDTTAMIAHQVVASDSDIESAYPILISETNPASSRP
jgi:hypothetical protein